MKTTEELREEIAGAIHDIVWSFSPNKPTYGQIADAVIKILNKEVSK